jgi:hypothetical protein
VKKYLLFNFSASAANAILKLGRFATRLSFSWTTSHCALTNVRLFGPLFASMSNATIAVAWLAAALSDMGSFEKSVRARLGDEGVEVGCRKNGRGRHIKRNCFGIKI